MPQTNGRISTTGPKMTSLRLTDEDFLSEHLGSLLVRQPISPKSNTSTSLPFGFTKGPISASRHSSLAKQSASSKNNDSSQSDSIDQAYFSNEVGAEEDHHDPPRTRSKTFEGQKVVTTPGAQSPCEEVLASFFTTPNSDVIANNSTRGSLPTNDNRGTVADINLNTPFGGQHSAELRRTSSAQHRSAGSVSFTTSFGVRRHQVSSSKSVSRSEIDNASLASFGSSSNLQYSRRPSDGNGSSQLPSGTDSDETSPETPSDGETLDKELVRNTSCSGEIGDNRSTFSSIQGQPNVSSESLNDSNLAVEGRWPTMDTLPSPNEEKKKWQIFNQGGIIEPPETSESSSLTADVTRKNTPKRPKVGVSYGSSNSQTSSRFTSMTSSRFQSSQSTSSSLPTEMDIHDEGKRFVFDGRRTKISASTKAVGDQEQKGSIPIAKQLAMRANSVTLVPAGNDGRTFVFVSNTSQENVIDQAGLRNVLRTDGRSL